MYLFICIFIYIHIYNICFIHKCEKGENHIYFIFHLSFYKLNKLIYFLNAHTYMCTYVHKYVY